MVTFSLRFRGLRGEKTEKGEEEGKGKGGEEGEGDGGSLNSIESVLKCICKIVMSPSVIPLIESVSVLFFLWGGG